MLFKKDNNTPEQKLQKAVPLPNKSPDKPKLDMTSFGHWSGTGLVDWN